MSTRKPHSSPQKRKMILTTCAACAAPLAHDHKPRCSRCKTRYCNAANNYAFSLAQLKRFEEAKTLLRKTMPVARRVLGEHDDTMLRQWWNYAMALYKDPGATLDDLREAVTTLDEIERTARRVLGGAHPTTVGIEEALRDARAALRAREATPPSA